MKIKKNILLFVLVINYAAFSQEYKCYSCETGWGGYIEVFTLHDSIIVRDTIRDTIYLTDMKEIASGLNMSFDEFIHQFLDYARKQKQEGSKLYISHLMAKINEHAKNYRYVLNRYWLDFPKDASEIKNQKMQLPQNIPDSTIMEYVFKLEGKNNTINFLNSQSEQLEVIHRLLHDIKENKKEIEDETIKKRIALNFYFPDFSYKEKRAMAQFVKSVSLVIDSIKVKELTNLPLYFTFNTNGKKANLAYLVGLCDMVDKVFVAASDVSLEEIDRTTEISTFDKVINQFYLARIHTDDFPDIKEGKFSPRILQQLMNADYPNVWEGYFLGIIGIVLLLIIGTACYFFISPFANFINENYMYVFAGVIILITEIILLFVFMIEEMTSKTKVFNLWEILLVLILLIIVIPLIKKGISNKETP